MTDIAERLQVWIDALGSGDEGYDECVDAKAEIMKLRTAMRDCFSALPQDRLRLLNSETFVTVNAHLRFSPYPTGAS